MKDLTDRFLVAISRFGMNFQVKFGRMHNAKADVSEQLNQSMGLLLEDRKRLVEELAQIRLQIKGLTVSPQTSNVGQSSDAMQRDRAIAEISELKIRMES
jgi:hypothetical protein